MKTRTVYASENERKIAVIKSQTLVNSLRRHCGLSYEKLAQTLQSQGVQISAGMLRQIASGRKALTSSKLHRLAIVANAMGHKDDVIKEALANGDPDDPNSLNWLDIPAELYQQFGDALADHEKVNRMAQQEAIDRLERALRDLMPWNWNDAELLYIVIAVMERLPIDLTGGSSVRLETLPVRRQEDSSDDVLYVAADIHR
jgi:transcriptional regulator with XRE-family HTH domain